MKTLALAVLCFPWLSLAGAVAHALISSKRRKARLLPDPWRKFRGHGEVEPFVLTCKLIPGHELIRVLR